MSYYSLKGCTVLFLPECDPYMEERSAESVEDPSYISTTSLVKVWNTTNWPKRTAKNKKENTDASTRDGGFCSN